MNPDKFREHVDAPKRTREDLEQMRDNARNKGEGELARIAEIALAERFPSRGRARQREGRGTPATARFRKEQEWFPSSKEAYVWLMQKFIQDRPDILEGEDWQRAFIAKGRAVNYFAKDVESLFRRSPHLAKDSNKYAWLGGGWYADVNLNNVQKFDALCRFGAAAEYEFKKDWDWGEDGLKTEEGPVCGLRAALSLAPAISIRTLTSPIR